MSAIRLAELASRVLLGFKGWTILVCAPTAIDKIVQELVDELEFLAEDEPDLSVRRLDMGTDGRAFVDALTSLPLSCVCVVRASTSEVLSAIGFVEASRGRLVAGPTVIVVTESLGARAIAATSPNLWSWIGSRAWDDVAGIAAANIPLRLESFRAATGQTDEEVVTLAEARQLSIDPLYAEWLALLGRGDLLGY